MKNDDQLELLRSGIDVIVRVLKISDAAELADGKTRLNPSDAQSLVFIASHEGCIGADVAKWLGVSATTVSSIIDRLVRRGLIQRERTEANRRIILLLATPVGQAAAQAILEEQRKHCAQMLEALPKHVRKEFVAHIHTIATKIHPEKAE